MATKKKPGDYLKVLPPEERKKRASAGGQAVVNKRGAEYMRELGRRGGMKATREHLARIGKIGGAIPRLKKQETDAK